VPVQSDYTMPYGASYLSVAAVNPYGRFDLDMQKRLPLIDSYNLLKNNILQINFRW